MIVDGRTIRSDLLRGRAFRLLCLLLANRFQLVPTDVIYEAFWPKKKPEKAARILKQWWGSGRGLA